MRRAAMPEMALLVLLLLASTPCCHGVCNWIGAGLSWNLSTDSGSQLSLNVIGAWDVNCSGSFSYSIEWTHVSGEISWSNATVAVQNAKSLKGDPIGTEFVWEASVLVPRDALGGAISVNLKTLWTLRSNVVLCCRSCESTNQNSCAMRGIKNYYSPVFSLPWWTIARSLTQDAGVPYVTLHAVDMDGHFLTIKTGGQTYTFMTSEVAWNYTIPEASTIPAGSSTVLFSATDRTFKDLEPYDNQISYAVEDYGSSTTEAVLYVKAQSACTPDQTPFLTSFSPSKMDCFWNDNSHAGCKVKLQANLSAADVSKLSIQMTDGYGASCALNGNDFPNCLDSCKSIPPSELDCLPDLSASDIGKSMVYCYTAVATYSGTSIGTRCYSKPICFRYNILGRSPVFQSPSPSFLGPGNVKYPACLGAPLGLNLVASDSDPAESVRIFVDDVSPGAGSFFSDLPGSASSCGQFGAYKATRVGDNMHQIVARTLSNASLDSSINASVSPNVSFSGTSASQTIVFNLDVRDGNVVLFDNETSAGFTRRSLILNDKRTICAHAYDNTRFRYHRWANREYEQLYFHNLGSYVTTQCWDIVMQAPPVFVTSPDGCKPTKQGKTITYSCTPFTEPSMFEYDFTAAAHVRAKLDIPVGFQVVLTLTAMDPNPEDRVEILFLDNPGLPVSNVMVERSTCVAPPSTSACSACTSKCHSSCNVAQRRLMWTPANADMGRTFKLCALAKDDSTMCAGRIPDASSQGWSGERYCVELRAVQLRFRWTGSLVDWMVKSAAPLQAFVGCTLSLDLIPALDLADYSATGSVAWENATANMVEVQTAQSGQTSSFYFRPMRGSEGRLVTACFAVGSDSLSFSSRGICREDGNRNCNSDADCGAGRCSDVCINIQVDKCRYCVKKDNVLGELLGNFGLKTNWMRIWTLNADSRQQLGTFCEDYLDCERSSTDSSEVISDRSLLARSAAPWDKVVVWVGTQYSAESGETARQVSCKFRTAFKDLQSMNPDLPLSSLDFSFPSRSSVCIPSCSVGPTPEERALMGC
eukprot:762717-Hanusia_phi.AAC.2